MRGAGDRHERAERARIGAANHGLVVQGVSEAKARPEGAGNKSRPACESQCCPDRARENDGAGDAAGSRDSAWSARNRLQRSSRPVGGRLVSQRRPKIQNQLAVHMPVVLDEAREIRELLADETDVSIARSRHSRAGTTRRHCRPALGSVPLGTPVSVIAEADAASLTLPAEAVVVIELKHAAELESVRAVDPGEIVVVRIDGIFGSVVGLAAPTACSCCDPPVNEFTRLSLQSGTLPRQNLSLPIADVLLRRLVILTPVVAAGIKVIELGGAERPIPTEANDVGGLLQVVVVGVEAGQRGRTVGPGTDRFAIVAVVAGDAVLLVEDVIAFDAALIHRLNIGAVSDDVVVVDIADRSRRGAGVRRERAAASGRRPAPGPRCGLKWLWESCCRETGVRVTVPFGVNDLRGGVVDRNLGARWHSPTY